MDFSPNKDAVSPAVLSMDPAPSPAASPRMNVPAHGAWGRPQSATGEVPYTHVMGVAEYWPALSGEGAMPPAVVAPKVEASTTTAKMTENLAAKMTCHGDHAALARPEPTLDGHGAVLKSRTPPQAPNYRSNGDTARHPNGRFPPRHQSRGAHNGGNGRGVDGGIGVGNGNTNVNFSGYSNGGVHRHGQGHRGCFGMQHQGRGRQWGGHAPGHMQHGHHMSYVAPHPFAMPQPPPPPFYGAYYGPEIGYAQTEFAPAGWQVPLPPPPDAAHFVPYPALPVHAMLPQMEQPHVEDLEQWQTSVEDLQKKIRCQIDFYFRLLF